MLGDGDFLICKRVTMDICGHPIDIDCKLGSEGDWSAIAEQNRLKHT